MAGTSPTRRSSRARTTQPQPQLSSAASSLSGRAERSSRALNKAGSPQKSTGSGSLSSEPPEDSTATTASSDDNLLLRRRSTRNRDDERDKETKLEVPEMAITSDDNEIQEDDEAVRCVCGYEDYPGLPLLDEDCKNHALKDAIDVEQIFSIELTDDLAGFFVQCDVCKVWEHGLCMGIVNEDLIPDDYYCELCRKDLHKIYAASNGQKYSIYLPLHRPSRATSRATSATKEGARSPKSGDRKSSRTSAAAAAAAAAQSMAKRRSTMNSRDAAYDEEQLRRAIEISQKEVVPEDGPEGQLRRPKRSRDEDDEQPEIKRQRTNSKSPSPEEVPLASREESEDESATRNGIFKKSSRNTVRSQREKTEREERREEQERKRAEAANKRKGRAERRRAEGEFAHFLYSDPSEEAPPTARAAVTRTADVVHHPDPPASSQPVPDTPPADQVPASSNKKRTGLHPKKKGRNQYTKDREHHLHEDSPARSMSRDIARDKDDNHTKSNHEGGSKHSKSKGAMNSRITMTDLKRRANNLMEFITRTQVELANEPLSERNSPHQPASEDGSEVPVVRQNGSNAKMLVTNGISMSRTQDFKEMSCVEMMDALTRDLVKWQQEFAA
ncbi:putative Zinc finger PHD-type domain-containing protein [Seiridium cardinale]|uniref:Zinc finger PHD-type domain-containing protein n=1 Tax=Seiridium cardinale TaxID=138064 RepID=A0ABR2XRJ6_9PEZI